VIMPVCEKCRKSLDLGWNTTWNLPVSTLGIRLDGSTDYCQYKPEYKEKESGLSTVGRASPDLRSVWE
jgi:hypothetical protein